MRRFVVVSVLCLVALVLAGCGGGEDDSSEAASSEAGDSQEAMEVEAEEEGEASDGEAGPPPDGEEPGEGPVEAAIVFEERELVSAVGPGRDGPWLGSVTVGVPEGWVEAADFPGLFRPESDSFEAQFSVGGTCGGACVQRTAAEWAEVAEETEFSQFRDEENFEIEIEEDLADGKLLVATNSFGLVLVSVARWIEGRTEYFYCRFATNDSVRYPLAGFEEACRGARIDDLPESSSVSS